MLLFNIAPNFNFLQSLSIWIADNFQSKSSDLLLILPSKRACSEFKSICESNPVLQKNFPRVTSISDLSFFDIKFINSKVSASSSNIYSKDHDDLKYIFELSKKLRNTQFFQNLNVTQSLNIASNLKNLFDDLSKSDIGVSDLDIDDFNMSVHRQFTINFLKEFYIDFKNFSRKGGILSSVDLQKERILHCQELLQEHGLSKKVIFAGSTGSVGYMKDFIKIIHESENGYLITNGLHERSGEIKSKDPAFLLDDLFSFLGVESSQVKPIKIAEAKLAPDERFDFLSKSFASDYCVENFSATNEQIEVVRKDFDQNFRVIKANNQIQEARFIAKHLKEGDFADKKVAIICPNVNLMVLVKRFLAKADIKFNDYEKYSLIDLEVVKLFLLIAKSINSGVDSISILSILKHSLVTDNKIAASIHKFEKEILRSYRSSLDVQDLIAILNDRKEESCDEDDSEEFLAISEILNGIFDLYKNLGIVNIYEIFTKIVAIIEGVTAKSFRDFFSEEQSRKFDQIYQNIEKIKELQLVQNEIHDFFAKIFSFATFSRDFDPELNIEITTPIEARLINYDLLFFTGLNKSSYPSFEKDNWISGKIRKDLGIFNNDKKISLAGYDFCNLLSNKEIILSYSRFVGSSKSTKSSFVSKLEAMLKQGEMALQEIATNQVSALKKKTIDGQVTHKSPQIKLGNYVKSFSASDIEGIVKAPYSFYARKILKLQKEKIIDFKPGNAEFGTFIHKLVEQAYNLQDPSQVKIEKLFYSFYKCKESKLIWFSKAKKILENFFIDNQQFLAEESYCEKYLASQFADFKITAKIDRIHVDEEGKISIIDYKTGTIPSIISVKIQKSPQLLIYAILLQNSDETLGQDLRGSSVKGLQEEGLAQNSGQNSLRAKNIDSIRYWKLASNKNDEVKKVLGGEALNLSMQQMQENLQNLMRFFSDSNARFEANPPEKFQDEYFHLSRINKY